MKIRWLDSVGSTNSWLKAHTASVEPLVMVCAREQSAGRGQRGNSWEAEPGKNLTFSFYLADLPVAPAEQFIVSEAVALAMVATLREFGITAKVKWPNDIYVGDRKIAGILIENSIMGTAISQSIVGIGLNVNQTLFLSDAPNPVSMALLAGHEFDLGEVARAVGRHMEKHLSRISTKDALHQEYTGTLWRADGRPHRFMETATGRVFDATVAGVALTGHLLLTSADGSIRPYAFKEVSWLQST